MKSILISFFHILFLLCLIKYSSQDMEKYIYECKDKQNNIYYLDYIKYYHGNEWIILEDGTEIKIINKKRILREEND